MGLDVNQIRQILKRPSKKVVIGKALRLQRRLRFHSETSLRPYDAGEPASIFLDWVRSILPLDKYNTFVQLFRFPLPTVTTVDDCYRELERVFDGRNASSTYQFTSSELAEDWADYRLNHLHEPIIWKTTGWYNMRVSPNSILVVDLPAVQVTERPEPYFYWLGIEHVVDYKFIDKSSVQFEWLIFRQPDKRIAVFDDSSIRVFQLNERGDIQSLISEAKHSLGYCPARFFWSTPLNEREPDLKKNPITKELAELDWLLFFKTSKQYLDLYAPYPIYSAYEADCDFENNETGEYCDGGFLRNSKGEYELAADGTVVRCPVCAARRTVGPGSFLEVPVPSQQEGVADMRNPVQITTIDRESLDYNVSECDRLKQEIIDSIIGKSDSVSAKEAINETQVAANFESKTAVLNALKLNFEEAQRFVDDTVCRFRYGGNFISSSISWGTEFYVFTVSELYHKYEQAKRNGAADAELDAIMAQIAEVEYKNNPLMLQRMQVLRHLEPYPHKTLGEIMDLDEKGLLDPVSVRIKLNFSQYIDRFERENINIIEFASNIPLKDKINIINNKLKEYVRESYNNIAE